MKKTRVLYWIGVTILYVVILVVPEWWVLVTFLVLLVWVVTFVLIETGVGEPIEKR